MKLQLIYIGQETEADAVYTKKISNYIGFEIRRLKSKKLDRDSSDAKREFESADILKAIGRDDFVIVCDEAGDEMNSVEFSKKLTRQIESGSKKIVVVIGGAFGINDAVKARANFKFSLSKLTFNHEVARLVVLEQLYRALCIWKNIPYHNA